jgi:arabinosaccharide transport system substrate-binding protein
MIDRYPFGRAPFWLTVVAIASMLGVLWAQVGRAKARPDLVLALSAPNHVLAYGKVEKAFEKEHGIDVALQLVNLRALTTRLQNAMLAGTEVPDVAELPFDAMAYFGRGPVKDIGFLDITERLTAEGYRDRLVEARLSLWSTRGRVFALPHDVHPVMLAYRADLVEGLGIDVEALKTWEDFVTVGRRVTADLDGDGAVDRYMVDLICNNYEGFPILLLQRGIDMFDAEGELTFNQPTTLDTLEWYLHQCFGKDRIAYDAGWGQPLTKAMTDGFVLFHVTPDWRSHLFEMDAPNLTGKMKLIPLPAWERGGRRTSVWGGSGLAVTKRGKNPELAWKFAQQLYFDKGELGSRFLETGIIPALKDAWSLPDLNRPNAYYSGQRTGTLYASLAPEVPPVWTHPYTKRAQQKLNEVLLGGVSFYRVHGDAGLREVMASALNQADAEIRRDIARNVLSKM